MKRMAILSIVVSLCILSTLGCGTLQPSPTPDVQATIDAAIEATSTVGAAVQATIDAAVAATGTANASPEATVEPTVQTAATVAPTPTPAAEYVAMTEEELAALIDQAAAEAAAATQECSTATAQATADDTVTPDEAEAVEVYVSDAEEAIAYAEELINAYYALYGDLAMETLYALDEIEEDLVLMADYLSTMNVALEEIDTLLAQGLALAEETLTQLDTAAETANSVAAGIQAQSQTWLQNLHADLENRTSTALGIQPNNVATDQLGALQSAFDYVDAVRNALGDNKISQTELSGIAQLGANASASLDAHGGIALQQLSGSISDITGQIASGQIPQAKANLGGLESALGSRPSRR
jgi:hypothetical protein